MSFEARFDPPTYENFDVDLTQCENCIHKNYDFECGQIGYCITDCGESYVVGSLLYEKGYINQINTDFAYDENGEIVPGIEFYRPEAKKFIKNMEKLGHTCTTYNHPLGKKYLTTVIIDSGIKPISLCGEFLKLEAIK